MPGGMCYLDKREALQGGIRHIYEYMTDMRLTVDRYLTEDGYVERYEWRNVGKESIPIGEEEVCVYATFAEHYDIREVTVPFRAYTHALCAGDTFYMYNARANGTPQGVGLVLEQGEIHHIQEERLHPSERGDLLLCMPPCTLEPDATIVWQWRIFAYADADEFRAVVARYAPFITVSPRYPAPGQSVTVTVDGTTPQAVWVNDVETTNPFPAPLGSFVLRPIEARENTRIEMVGASLAAHWARYYHAWPTGKNPRALLARSAEYAERFAQTHAQTDYDEAVAALLTYYRTGGAMRHPQAAMPTLLIRSHDQLKALFERHLQVVLHPRRTRFGAQTALAEYSMLRVANGVWDGRYTEEEAAAKTLAAPILDSPLGPLVE